MQSRVQFVWQSSTRIFILAEDGLAKVSIHVARVACTRSEEYRLSAILRSTASGAFMRH